MNVDIEKLEALAKAAGQSQWKAWPEVANEVFSVQSRSRVCVASCSEEMDFIAAANPATVLELIDSNKRLKSGAADTWEIAQSRARIIDQLKAEYRWFRENSLQIVHASPHCFVHRLDKAIDEAMSREAACTHSAN